MTITGYDYDEAPQDQLGTAVLVWTIEIPAYRLEKAEQNFATANRRLDKTDIEARFIPVYTPFDKKVLKGTIDIFDDFGNIVERIGGTEVSEPWIRITVEAFRISTGRHEFVASLVAEEAGYTVHTAPGQNLDGWKRPESGDNHCDHCNVKRDRTRLYVIRDTETGQLLQVGHSCIEAYTGLSPKGLWSLQYDEELRAFASEDTGGGFGSGVYAVPLATVLGMAYSFSQEGRSYISVKAAEWREEYSTSSQVRSAILFPPQRPTGRSATAKAIADWEYFMTKLRLGYEYAKDEALISEIKAVASTLKAGTDYADNMNVILAGERVSGKNFGILASLVSVYAREKELAVKRATAAPLAKGYLAEVGTRVKAETRVTLTTVRYWEGDYGTTTFMVGRTEDLHTVVWKASGGKDVEVGDTLVLSAFTVKAHEQYGTDNPIDQTVITRAVIKEILKEES
jgi:hypothetical protein